MLPTSYPCLIRAGMAVLLTSAIALSSTSAAQTLARVEATAPAQPARSEHLRMGTGTGPAGTIGINNLYATRNGRPWLPVMGEFHFSRYPAPWWEEEILKMKAAGITVIGTYILWNQHELSPGVLDWAGDRDIRRFAELCHKHGMLLFIRPGPWVHSESRFGGIPDWVVASTRVRSNDEAYLQQVERFWRDLHAQLKGLLWKDGGPIIGFQVENEFNLDGPGQGRAHIATLKDLARRIGFDVPLYTVTGWDQTIYPRGEVLPVMGGYPDEPWSAKTERLPPKENYLFRFDSRVSGDLGAQTRARHPGDADSDTADTPFLGAEYGGGVPVMYRRRPLLDPADVAAAVVTQVGSGVNLLGYYMFHGGANPLANGRGLEETQRSGGYNDVPMIGYDFQAPLGQYGEVNPVSASLRPLHYFLSAYGDLLATMAVRRPDEVPADKDDLKTLRWAVRSNGDTGFLFVNNHIRQFATPVHRDVRFDVKLPGGTLHLPSKGVDIPTGANFFWPINLDMDGVRLAWATAQPVTRLADADGPIHVFAATLPGPAELVFPSDAIRAISVPSSRDAAGRWVARVTPSARQMVVITNRDGKRVRLLVLDQESAGRVWVGELFGQRRMVLTDADLFFAPDRMVLRQRGNGRFRFAIWPQARDLAANVSLSDGQGGDWTASVSGPAPRELALRQTREAGPVPPVEIGGPAKAAMQPVPEAHRAAAAWSFTVPADALQAGSDAFLEIDYRGDIARLFDGMTMLDDAFWDGRRWRIGLKRFAERLGRPWTLTVLPLRTDAPIYLDDRARKQLPNSGQVAAINSIRLVPEYELAVTQR